VLSFVVAGHRLYLTLSGLIPSRNATTRACPSGVRDRAVGGGGFDARLARRHQPIAKSAALVYIFTWSASCSLQRPLFLERGRLYS
jgi:hypothetical protein